MAELIYGIPLDLLIGGVVIILCALLYPIVFKKRVLSKFSKEVQKSDLTWTDKNGEEHSEEVLFKKSKMPLIGDWGRVYPPINEDGTTNWGNLLFGGTKNLIKLVIIMTIIVLTFWWVMGTIGAGAEYLNGSKYVIIERTLFNEFCSQQQISEFAFDSNLNISVFKQET